MTEMVDRAERENICLCAFFLTTPLPSPSFLSRLSFTVFPLLLLHSTRAGRFHYLELMSDVLSEQLELYLLKRRVRSRGSSSVAFATSPSTLRNRCLHTDQVSNFLLAFMVSVGPCSHCPEVTLCSWQVAKIPGLTDLTIQLKGC